MKRRRVFRNPGGDIVLDLSDDKRRIHRAGRIFRHWYSEGFIFLVETRDGTFFELLAEHATLLTPGSDYACGTCRGSGFTHRTGPIDPDDADMFQTCEACDGWLHAPVMAPVEA